MRRHYRQSGLDENDLAPTPIGQFQRWFDEAHQEELPPWFEMNAMSLATTESTGHVTCRTVLLKGCSEEGLVFFTNYTSLKGRQLTANPHAALLFYWPQLERQVRVNGTVKKLDRASSEQYFHSRPRGSQLGAAASDQSQPIPSRAALDEQFQRFESAVGEGVVPLPDNWGGYRLRHDHVEFWQGRENRLHDRLVYDRDGSVWRITRLQP